MTESDIQNLIRLELAKMGCVSFRANVGSFFTKDGRPIKSGLPNGFPDLFGYRKSDGKMFFIEVKTDKGILSKEQKKMQEILSKDNVIHIVARCVDDIKVLEER